jgi:hypothetical protein
VDFLNSISSPVWFAMAGAFAIKLLEIAEIHKIAPAERPDFKDILYWVPFLILPMLGGGLAQVYVSSNTVLNPLLAVNIGVSAPLMLRAMAQAVPETSVVDVPQSA